MVDELTYTNQYVSVAVTYEIKGLKLTKSDVNISSESFDAVL